MVKAGWSRLESGRRGLEGMISDNFFKSHCTEKRAKK
jgi:hypothetical protein